MRAARPGRRTVGLVLAAEAAASVGSSYQRTNGDEVTPTASFTSERGLAQDQRLPDNGGRRR